jgi:serine/threonine protein kinase
VALRALCTFVSIFRHDLSYAVAIKILDKKAIKANELTVNVRREIAIMKALKHKNIVSLQEVLSSTSKLYIVMDLVRGGELFEMIERKGELDEDLARKYFQQLVDGIDYCHRRGVYHRDLKPENLLVDEKGILKIADFGVSSMKSGPDAGLLHTQCGTPYYCAPEIIGGAEEGYSGVKIDAWSCGIILYLLLTGTLPFQNEDMTELYKQIIRCRVDYPKWMPRDAKDLISCLLRKDSDARYSLEEVKRHKWFIVNYEVTKNSSGKYLSGSNGSSKAGSSTKSKGRRTGSDMSGTARSDDKIDRIRPTHNRSPRGRQSRDRYSFNDIEHPPAPQIDQGSFDRLLQGAGGISSYHSSTARVAVSADPPAPVIRDIAAQFEDRDLDDLIVAALPGKALRKIDEVVSRLEDLDIDCVEDLQFLGESLGSSLKFTAWLEERTKLPPLTCMRIANFFW